MHRDLKPQNILIEEFDRAFIADIGVAKKIEGTFLANLKRTVTTVAGAGKMEVSRSEISLKSSLSGENKKILISDSKIDVFSLGLITLYAIDKDCYKNLRGVFNKNQKLLEEYIQDV